MSDTSRDEVRSEHNARCCALQQLESALSLYCEGKDYYSPITLAGAAEEISGQFLRAEGGESSYDSDTRTAVAIGKALTGEYVEGEEADPTNLKEAGRVENAARNFLKHGGPKTSTTMKFDAKEEAEDMLRRAIDHYWRLEFKLAPAMQKFDDCTVKDEPQLRSHYTE